jgi:hypothetical protein
VFPISLIIPVRADSPDKVRYLDECLASCHTQGHPVVVDDGSPRSLASIRLKYPHVIWDKIDALGKSAARNRAVELAQTELIYPLDADDTLQPGALQYLYDRWAGVPLYTHLIKWYTDGREVEHRLPTFSCAALRQKCVVSVNVLHTKAMWAHVGGWPVGVQLYEDWLYNFKLLWCFCGDRIPHALVKYRQHRGQSTAVMHGEEKMRRAETLAKIEEYVKEFDMPCCGKRRRSSPTTSTAPTSPFSAQSVAPSPTDTQFYGTATLSNLTTVDARYVGGVGRGAHTYRGPTTRKPYRVRTGVIVRAAVEDTCTEDEWKSGIGRHSLLVRQSPPPPPPVSPVVAQSVPVAPPPKPVIEKSPAPVAPPPVSKDVDLSFKGDVSAERIAEISDMTVKDILVNYKSWGDLREYLAAEQAGKNRTTVCKFLERQISLAEG